MTYCIGPCPIVFLARIPSLTVTTICLMWLAKKIVKLLSSKNRVLRISLVSALLLLSAVASIVVNHILFSLLVNLVGGGGICTGLVPASPLEISIPSLGTLFVLTRKADRRIFKFIHYGSHLTFLAVISMSLYEGVLWNLILYDVPWNSSTDWSWHGDNEVFLKYENRIHYFSITVVIYFSIIFSFLINRLLGLVKSEYRFVKGFLFTGGLLVTWIMSTFFYIESYQSLVYSGLGMAFVCFSPGLFIKMIPILTFVFTSLIVNNNSYGFWGRFSKIRAVKKNTKFSLEQIKIASPCPASWEEMIGDDTVRFCQICSKNVYNLSSMSKAEAQTLVMNNQGKLCGRLYMRKDGSVMTSDCQVGFGEIRRRLIKKVAQIAVAAFALIGLQQFFISGWNEELAPPRQDRHIRESISSQQEDVKEFTMGAIGYIEE